MDADFKRQIAQGVDRAWRDALIKKQQAQRVKRAEQRGALKALRKFRYTIKDQIEEFGRRKELADMDGDTVMYVTLDQQQATLIEMKAELEYQYQQVCNEAARELT